MTYFNCSSAFLLTLFSCVCTFNYKKTNSINLNKINNKYNHYYQQFDIFFFNHFILLAIVFLKNVLKKWYEGRWRKMVAN